MSPIDRVKNWAKEIVDLAVVLIAFGVVVSIIFGPDNGWYFSDITKNLIQFINELGSNSLAGIIALFVIIYAFSRRSTTA
jgi:H+/gluconate symporter-like permease